MSPLLLLDDIFDKLDAGRVGRIISTVGADTFGQIFITDTNRRHLDEIVAFMGADHRLWSVEHGRFSVIDKLQFTFTITRLSSLPSNTPPRAVK